VELHQLVVKAARLERRWRGDGPFPPIISTITVSESPSTLHQIKIFPGGDWLAFLFESGTIHIQSIEDTNPVLFANPIQLDSTERHPDPTYISIDVYESPCHGTIMLLMKQSQIRQSQDTFMDMCLVRVDHPPCHLFPLASVSVEQVYLSACAGELLAYSWCTRSFGAHFIHVATFGAVGGGPEKEVTMAVQIRIGHESIRMGGTIAIVSEQGILFCTETGVSVYPSQT